MLTNGNYQSMFMTTGEGVILIDAPEPVVQYIERAVADVTDEPIATLIYSHGHSDHIGGSHLLARPGLEIIAEQRVADFVKKKQQDGRRLVPTRVFDEELMLTKGFRTISLKRDEFHSPEGDLYACSRSAIHSTRSQAFRMPVTSKRMTDKASPYIDESAWSSMPMPDSSRMT